MTALGAPKSLRLFVAVMIPEAVKAEIDKAQAELRRSQPAGCVGWTSPEHFHLTLKFLGNVEEPRVEALTDALRITCQGFPPLWLRAEGIGFFPDSRFPRVIWAGLSDSAQQLPQLQRRVEAATREFTIEKPADKFTGHITLGRIKRFQRSEAEVLAKLGTAMTERFFGEWRAENIQLMRSELLPAGARHTQLARLSLAGPSRQGQEEDGAR